MPNSSMQQIQQLNNRLHDLIEQVRGGLPGDAIIAELQAVLLHLRDIATHDELTGTLNRRGLVQRLEGELMRAKRTGHPFSVAVIAIDDHDAISARCGRETGRQVLRQFAQVALALLRSLDSVGRIDHDIFGVILPTTWLDQSDKAIARLTAAVSGTNWDALVPGLIVSFSSGVTTNAPGDTADDMLQRATEALRQAQSQGAGACVQLEQALPDIDPDSL